MSGSDRHLFTLSLLVVPLIKLAIAFVILFGIFFSVIVSTIFGRDMLGKAFRRSTNTANPGWRRTLVQ
jgi:hypothetical protein